MNRKILVIIRMIGH